MNNQARNYFALALVALLALPGLVQAAALKIGYVNTVKVIEQAPQAKTALERLEKEFAPRDKKLVEKRERIKIIETELEKNSLVLNDAERRNKERELLGLKRDVRRATQEFREDYNLRRNEELAALQKLVYKTIVDLAKKKKFDLILHEGTVYASEQIDITDQVLESLRSKFTQ
ncbi:MAG: OmpH family outer membrane protein [Acidiferrobacterales bacterium]|jgi:outer membrane protein|nr:OmpH family outer membrane protein [Acidiferrobacterales bacterium]